MTTAVSGDVTDLFTGELGAAVRRMGERPRGGAGLPEELARARAAVRDALADHGGLAAAAAGTENPAHLVALAELMGRALYRGPYPDTATAVGLVAALRSGARDDVYADLLDAVAEGAADIALAARAEGTGDPAVPGPLVLADGPDGPRVTAVRRFVPFAADVEVLLVAGTVPTGVALALVAADDPAVTLRRHDEITRGDLYAVELQAAPVLGGALLADPAVAGAAWALAVAGARLRHAAALVGLAQGAVDLAVHRARTREQFGRPLAGHQSVAFTLAALTARITAVRVLTEESAHALAAHGDGRDPAVPQTLALAADLARDAAAQALHLHGAHGMTEDADIQLFFRRAALDAVLWGSPAQLRAAAAAAL